MSCSTTNINGHATPTKIPSPRTVRDNQEPPASPVPTNQEILTWTFTKGAVAPCFVRDVFTMRSSGVKDADFFWLGRVPCRSVHILGLIVGIQIYEKRIVYSVDDGTSVIDCFHRQSAQSTLPKTPSTEVQSKALWEPQDMPKPMASLGSLVSVVGRVLQWHESRQISVDCIEKCLTFNEEPAHWKIVLSLHKYSYSLPGPFVIPPLSYNASEPEDQHLNEQAADSTKLRPLTPSSCSSTRTTPVSSPSKSSCSLKSPPRLRHPSRLHSRDLTANTFRIYIKHYMDNAVHLAQPPSDDEDDLQFGLDFVPRVTSRALATPTKMASRSNDVTPKPRFNRTPHQSQIPSQVDHQESGQSEPVSNLLGFTLSYLRRVPELSEMARRVVQAEAKRRERAERKRTKEAGSKRTVTPAIMDKETIAPKMKRLFRFAIVKLYEEGSIILWDGPVRACLRKQPNGTGLLWKTYSSTNTSLKPNTDVFSLVSDLDGVEAELSDPQPDEEAYVPLTPTYLAPYVEKAIDTLMLRPSKSRKAPYDMLSPPGPTPEDITMFLRRSDSRWMCLGAWAVADALELLRAEERVWAVGDGRWELCL